MMAEQKIWTKWLFALILNISFFAVFYFFMGRMHFATCEDDLVLCRIADGSFGQQYSAYLIFSNYVLGMFVKLIFLLFPKIQWWIILQIIFSIASFTVLTEVLEEKFGIVTGLSLGGCLLIFFGGNHFADFSFTQNAALYIAAGFFGFLAAEKKIRENKGILLGGAGALLLVWLGFLVRQKVFLCALPYMIVVLLLFVPKFKKYIHLWGCLGGLTILVIGAFGIDKLAYASESWRDYRAYNKACADLLDYELPQINSYPEVYKSVEMTENDYELLSSWVYADSDIFSVEHMKTLFAVVADHHKMRFDKEIIKNTMMHFENAVREYHYGYFLLGLSGLALALLPWKKWWAIAGVWGCLGAEYWYLACMGRWVFRVEYGIWLFAILFMLYLCVYEGRQIDKKKEKMVVCIGCMLGIFLLSFYKRNEFSMYAYAGTVPRKSTDFENLLKYVSEHNENIYMCSSVGGQISQYELLDVMPENCMENLYYLGGWTVPSPIMQEKLDWYCGGLELPALMEYDNAYLVDTRKIGMIDTFLKEHYGFSGTYEVVDTVGIYTIYRFYE